MSAAALTTPIYYVNGLPHIGHTYSTVVADTWARYLRLTGAEVYFQTGTDEHGEKAQAAAAVAGETPPEYTRRMSAAWRKTWDTLGIKYDRFIRTTDADHKSAVAKILQRIWDAGQVEFREYEGLYCIGCERFLTERDLHDGRCADHETKPEARREANYFFNMSAHFEWLAQHLQQNPDFIKPARYRNEALAMLREGSGLERLCISRPKSRLNWGIELPFDKNYVCYVWFDALVNYLAGCGWPAQPGWRKRWQNCTHVIGKDILKPHGVYWPTMLHAAGLPLPRGLRVHGHWQLDNRKVAKSLGNLVDPLKLRARYGFEPFRYFLLSEMSFGLDGSFSEAAMVERCNAQLANGLGNLLSRTLNMLKRYCGGAVPAAHAAAAGDEETALQKACAAAAAAVDKHARAPDLHKALEALFRAVDSANRYLEQKQPWQAAKKPGGEAAVQTALYNCCQALHCFGLLLAAFLPQAAQQLLAQLGAPDALAAARLPAAALNWNALPPGTKTAPGAALFPRLELQKEAGDVD